MKYFILFLLILCVPFLVLSQENSVLNITIKGTKKTKNSFLRKLIKTKKNYVLDSIQLKKDITVLKRLPSVSHAYFQVFKSHDNFYNVFINIEENITILPEVAFWTSVNNQFSYKLGVYDYNFLGRNIAFGGFYQNNGFNTYAINFSAPNLFSNQWGVAFSHQNWKSEEPLYFNNQTANYLYNNISYEALLLYQINFKNQINFGVNFFKEKYQYLSGDTNPNIPQTLDISKVLYKLVYTYNALNYYYQYVSGFKSTFYGQFVKSNTNFQDNFLIFWNDFFYYKTIGKKGNWANRLRIGIASNNDSPFAPFALDNNINLRGVGILVDRGTASIVLNSEYRHTLYDKKWFTMQGNVFVDAGTWRNPGGALSDFLKNENARVFSGLGLRFSSKKIYNATFRIDYGFNLTDNSKGFVFGVGQYF